MPVRKAASARPSPNPASRIGVRRHERRVDPATARPEAVAPWRLAPNSQRRAPRDIETGKRAGTSTARRSLAGCAEKSYLTDVVAVSVLLWLTSNRE